jgi:PE family
MGFVSAGTDLIGQAATDLAAIRSDLDAAMTSMAGPTRALAPAGQDEISAAIAAVFSDAGTQFQAYQAQAARFHDSFAKLMNTGAMAYAQAEVANAAAAAAPTGDFGQIGGAIEGFLGEQLEGSGDLIGDIGFALKDGGEFLAPEGAGITANANFDLATLQTGGLDPVLEGEFLGAFLADAPTGFIEQNLGSASQFIGNGLFQTGTAIFDDGANLVDAAEAAR